MKALPQHPSNPNRRNRAGNADQLCLDQTFGRYGDDFPAQVPDLSQSRFLPVRGDKHCERLIALAGRLDSLSGKPYLPIVFLALDFNEC